MEDYVAAVWLDNISLGAVIRERYDSEFMKAFSLGMAKEYSAKGSSEVFDKDVEAELNLSFISFACNLPTGNYGF